MIQYDVKSRQIQYDIKSDTWMQISKGVEILTNSDQVKA